MGLLTTGRIAWKAGAPEKTGRRVAGRRYTLKAIVKVLQLACVLFILWTTFAPLSWGARGGLVDSNFEIHARSTVVCKNWFQLVMLGISRSSAYSLFLPIILVVVTKCKLLVEAINSIPWANVLFADALSLEGHEIHVAMGNYIAVDACIHGLCHTLRWADQGNLPLYWEHATGISGFLALFMLLFIAAPMSFQRLRRAISYEYRKAMHYLAFPFTLALVYHLDWANGFLPQVATACLVMYGADKLALYYLRTKSYIPNALVTPSGVLLTFKEYTGPVEGFIYINAPHISNWEWHPFSIFSSVEGHAQVYMMKQGKDSWTSRLHDALAASDQASERQFWVQGPVQSPYKSSINHDKLFLVASGIGITPALEVLYKYSPEYSSRKVIVLWMVNKPDMLNIFYDHIRKVVPLPAEGEEDGVMVYYTGKDAKSVKVPLGVQKGRPKPSVKAVVHDAIMRFEQTKETKRYNANDAKWKLQTLKGRFKAGIGAVVSFESLKKVPERSNKVKPEAADIPPSPALVDTATDIEAAAPAESSAGPSNAASSVPIDRVDCSGWGIMYCGGAPPVVKELTEVHEELQVPLAVESFDCMDELCGAEVLGLTPRGYQRLALESTIERNTIVNLPTGTGKTLVAVLAIDHFRRVHPGRAVVFIAPTRVLVHQQAGYLRQYCASGPSVKELVGMDMDFWDQERWRVCLKKHNCLVGTPEVFRKALCVTKFLRLQELSLVVFDECHRAVGNDPMVAVMRDCLWQVQPGGLPRILGLTASFAACRLKNPDVTLVQQRANLEGIYQAQMMSPDVPPNVKKYVQVQFSEDTDKVLKEKSKDIEENLRDVVRLVEVDCKQRNRKVASLQHVLEELGKEPFLNHLETGGCLLPAVPDNNLNKVRMQHQYYTLAEHLRAAPAISDKFQALLSLLKGDLRSRRGIIFVQQTVLLIPLSNTINQELCRVNEKGACTYISGISTMSQHDQNAAIKRFKSSEGVRVLVSTNAVEEGIDVSDCEFVVRFNPIQTTKSHIQGSGRARLADAVVYYFHNDPIYEEALAVQMASVANDAQLSLSSELLLKRKADHFRRSTVANVHPYRHGPVPSEITVYNAVQLVTEFCQKNLRGVDAKVLTKGEGDHNHCEGCRCIVSFRFPDGPSGPDAFTYQHVSADVVDAHWGGVRVEQLLESNAQGNICVSSAENCKRRFLYVVAVHMVQRGLINSNNQPVVIARPGRLSGLPASQEVMLLDNAKNCLQEWCIKRGIGKCIYEVTPSGPPHERRFRATCIVGDSRFESEECRKVKEAEKLAAKAALVGLGAFSSAAENPLNEQDMEGQTTSDAATSTSPSLVLDTPTPQVDGDNNPSPPKKLCGVHQKVKGAQAPSTPNSNSTTGSRRTTTRISDTANDERPPNLFMQDVRQPMSAFPLALTESQGQMSPVACASTSSDANLETAPMPPPWRPRHPAATVSASKKKEKKKVKKHADNLSPVTGVVALHLNVFVVVEPPEEATIPKNHEETVLRPQEMGLLTMQRMPDMPEISLYKKKNRQLRVPMELQDGGGVSLSAEELASVRRFHSWYQHTLAFVGGWHHHGVNTSGKVTEESIQAAQWYLAVPVVPDLDAAAGWGIDWANLREPGMPWLRELASVGADTVTTNDETKEDSNSPQLIHQESATTELNVDLGDTCDKPLEPGCMVRMEGTRGMVYACRCLSELTASAPCERRKFSNYVEMSRERHGVELDPDGLLVEANYIRFHPRNSLFYTPTETLKNDKYKSRVKLPLERCRRMCMPAGIWLGVLDLPSLVWRLEAMLLAEELLSHICAAMSEGGSQDDSADSDAGSLDPTLRKHLIHELLAAITHPCCCEDVNYQVLELLGDSFLKYAVSLDLFLHRPEATEGVLTNTKSRIVSNQWLQQAAASFPPGIGLKRYLRVAQLRCGLSRDNTNLEQSPSAKSLADCVEAVVGVVYLNLGAAAATKITHKLGLTKSPCMDLDAYAERNMALYQANWKKEMNIREKADTGATLGDGGEWTAQLRECNSETCPQLVSIEEAERGLEYRFQGGGRDQMLSLGRTGRLALLDEALTHGSTTKAQIHTLLSHDNQRLELIGDAVLDLLVVTHFVKRERARLSEGDISLHKSMSTSNTRFARLAFGLNLHQHLKVDSEDVEDSINKYVRAVAATKHQQELDKDDADPSELTDGTAAMEVDPVDYPPTHDAPKQDALTKFANRCAVSVSMMEDAWLEAGAASELAAPKVLADLFEGVAGALLLDSHFDLERVWSIMGPRLVQLGSATNNKVVKHPLSMLYEYCQCFDESLRPEFKSRADDPTSAAPDSGSTASNTTCSVDVLIHGQVVASASANTNKKAMHLAAFKAVQALQESPTQLLRLMKERPGVGSPGTLAQDSSSVDVSPT